MVHAHYVEHRFVRHSHEHLVVGIVEQGVQNYTYLGGSHNTPPGQTFFVNGGEPHTGKAAIKDGYLYRTLCLDPESFRQLTLDITGRNETPYLVGRHDPFVPVSNAEGLHRGLPRSTLNVLDCGHFVWEDAWEEYGRLAGEFIRGGYAAL